jgi:hypothetical protein
MLDKPNSFNNKLILEVYKHTQIQAENRSGWVTPGQKNNLKGLRVLITAILTDGMSVPVGSRAWIKEESLHTCQWAKNKLKSDTLDGEFIVVNMSDVEYVTPPDGEAA